jgi:hypothetical protein
MTWLPISVKNAAKCDKWYVLQNHPITESLNAKGAREKLFASDPRACRMLSVEQTKKHSEALLGKRAFGPLASGRRFVVSRSCPSGLVLVGAIRGSLAFPFDLGKERKRPKINTPRLQSSLGTSSFRGLSSAEKGGNAKHKQQISEFLNDLPDAFLHCLHSKLSLARSAFRGTEMKTNQIFTDLSTVGLPAELKHITQRRKRKQP